MLDPSYIRSIRDGILNGNIEANNQEALPDGLVGLYDKELFPPTMKWRERKETLHFFLVFAIAQKEISADFASAILGDEWFNLHNDDESKEEKRLQKVNDLIQLHSKRLSSAGEGKYRLYHERYRLYILQKVSDEDIAQFNSRFISLCETALEITTEKDISEKESYALEFISTHYFNSAMQGKKECLNKAHADALKKYAYDQKFWERQVKLNKRYLFTRRTINQLSTWALKFNLKLISLETSIKTIQLSKFEFQHTNNDFINLLNSDFELFKLRLFDLQSDNKYKFNFIIKAFEYFKLENIEKDNINKIINLIELLRSVPELLKIAEGQLSRFYPFILGWLKYDIFIDEIIVRQNQESENTIYYFSNWWFENHDYVNLDFENFLHHYINKFDSNQDLRLLLFKYYLRYNLRRCLKIISNEITSSPILPKFYFYLLEYYIEFNIDKCKKIFSNAKFINVFHNYYNSFQWFDHRKEIQELVFKFTKKTLEKNKNSDFQFCFELNMKIGDINMFADLCRNLFDVSFLTKYAPDLPRFYVYLLEHYIEFNINECKNIFLNDKFKGAFYDKYYSFYCPEIHELVVKFTEKTFEINKDNEFKFYFELNNKIGDIEKFAEMCAKFFDVSFLFRLIENGDCSIFELRKTDELDYYFNDNSARFIHSFIKLKVNQNYSLRKLRFMFGYFQSEGGTYNYIRNSYRIMKKKSIGRYLFTPSDIFEILIKYNIWLAKIAVILRHHSEAEVSLKMASSFIDRLEDTNYLKSIYIKEIAVEYLKMGIKNKWLNKVEDSSELLKWFCCSDIKNTLNHSLEIKNHEEHIPFKKISIKISKKQQRINFLLSRNYLEVNDEFTKPIEGKRLFTSNSVLNDIDILIAMNNHSDTFYLDNKILEKVLEIKITKSQMILIFDKFHNYQVKNLFVRHCIRIGPLSGKYSDALNFVNSSSNEQFKTFFHNEIKKYIRPKRLNLEVLIYLLNSNYLNNFECVNLLKKFFLNCMINDKVIKFNASDSFKVFDLKHMISIIWDFQEDLVEKDFKELINI
jgi:hypothetical protein